MEVVVQDVPEVLDHLGPLSGGVVNLLGLPLQHALVHVAKGGTDGIRDLQETAHVDAAHAPKSDDGHHDPVVGRDPAGPCRQGGDGGRPRY